MNSAVHSYWTSVLKDGYIPHLYCFRTFDFSLNLTGTLNLTKIVHYHWSRMGK